MGAVCIVGAGPSGCYLAQALLKAKPDLAVDLIDRSPAPYGLVRYGVAADHQGTKAVIRQFERLFERQGARFFGNVELERDVTLDELRGAYDAVVLALGLSADRRLGIEGEDLPGVSGAGALTRWLYDRPDAAPPAPLGRRVAVMGAGNVAIDILRLLAKTPAEFAGTDLGPEAGAWLAAGGVEEITLVARGAAQAAKFDPVMVKELAKLEGASIEVVGAEGEGPTIEALRKIDGAGPGPRRVRFRFGLTPVAVEGAGRVSAVRFRGASGEERIECESFFTAIGFGPEAEVERAAHLAAADEAGGRLFATGWYRRGPRGTIPENRAEAQALAARVLGEIGDGEKAQPQLFAARAGTVDYAGWKRIDAAEIAAAPEDRCRVKIAERAAMLKLAAGDEEVVK